MVGHRGIRLGAGGADHCRGGCWRLRTLRSPRTLHLLLAAVCGGLAGGLPLAIYNLLAFGSVWHLGYSDVVGFAGMQTGLFGVSLPQADVALALLVGAKRGILWIAPILLVAPLAWMAAFRRIGATAAVPLVAIPVAYLLINSGYAYWDGGESTGPRHLTPALPFIGFAFVPLWQMSGSWGRRGLLVLAGTSFVLALMCATPTMVCPTFYRGIHVQNELTDLVLPMFLDGNVHNLIAPVGQGASATLLSLVIPVLLATGASRVVRSVTRRSPTGPAQAPSPAPALGKLQDTTGRGRVHGGGFAAGASGRAHAVKRGDLTEVQGRQRLQCEIRRVGHAARVHDEEKIELRSPAGEIRVLPRIFGG